MSAASLASTAAAAGATASQRSGVEEGQQPPGPRHRLEVGADLARPLPLDKQCHEIIDDLTDRRVGRLCQFLIGHQYGCVGEQRTDRAWLVQRADPPKS